MAFGQVEQIVSNDKDANISVPPAVTEAFNRAWEREGKRYGEYVVSEQVELISN